MTVNRFPEYQNAVANYLDNVVLRLRAIAEDVEGVRDRVGSIPPPGSARLVSLAGSAQAHILRGLAELNLDALAMLASAGDVEFSLYQERQKENGRGSNAG